MTTENLYSRNFVRTISFLAQSVFVLSLVFVATIESRSQEVGSGNQRHVLYVETNDQNPGQNAILAYNINPNDGSLSLLGTFPTRGTGGSNFNNIEPGPSDHAQEVVLSNDKRFLFAINGGSNTVAVFRVDGNGRLTHVQGSPFPSGGLTPVSVGQAGNKLYVVNANDNNQANVAPNNTPANYTGFLIKEDGRLEPIPGSTMEIASFSNSTQAHISPDNKFLFGVDLFAVPYQPPIVPFIAARGSLLESFQIQEDGTLKAAPGSPNPPPVGARLVPTVTESGYLLGVQAHPTERILYTGEVATNRLAVYSYDESGRLSLLTEVPVPGMAICWFAFDKDVKHLFASDAGTNSIAVFDVSNPSAPVHIQELQLSLPGHPPAPVPANEFPTENFQLALEPSGKFLYVVNHAITPNDDYPEGNAIHIMQVQPNGTLVEQPFSPLLLPVAPNVKPTGNAIF
jgi:6-phosphogluconolactonase (cycloisomerase 2 family)